jgi:transposase
MAQQYPFLCFEYTLTQREYYVKRGKPTPENVRIAQQISTVQIRINTTEIAKRVEQKSRFILTTNVLDQEKLPDEQILKAYKSQASSVENGFRFLKDPLFFAESFFVKKTSRLQGLLMIMTLSLLVYSLAERKLRMTLAQNNEEILNQVNKPTRKPTLRMVFNLFRGIHWVQNHQNKMFCTNLNENRKKIILSLGMSVAKYYFLSG